MKLDLDISKIDKCRECASDIADRIMEQVRNVTTTTCERAVLRLLGVDGVDRAGVPLPNVVVDMAHQAGLLSDGIATYMARAAVSAGLSLQQVAEKVACRQLDLADLGSASAT